MSRSASNLAATASMLEKMATDLADDGRISKPDVARQILLDAAVELRDLAVELRAEDKEAGA